MSFNFKFHILILLIIIILLLTTISCFPIIKTPDDEIDEDIKESTVTGEVHNTLPSEEGEIMIANAGNYIFNPEDIETIREDIFNDGYFSIFDILVHLDSKNKIELEYHFEENMNTYLIDSLNGMRNCWHTAYYDGGWPEKNVFRMDHYPYKDNMYISISEFDESLINSYYDIFTEEIKRKEKNKGKIIIPVIEITGPNTGNIIFEDIEIRPHNLRDDMFKKDTITAIDSILTLGDKGLLRYDLHWYDSILPDAYAGYAQPEIVRNYWVNGINDDIASGRCGFVYEAGSDKFRRFKGNHIHIPSDIRIINSPEYIEYFWICI